jgi:hypothetical protein
MPYTFYFDAENQIVLARFYGLVTNEQFIEFFRFGGRRVVATTDFRSMLIDLSDVTEFDVSAESARTLAWEEPIDPDPSRTRVMIAPEAHVYGLCRIFASHGEETRPNLHVVRSTEHAYAILSVVKPKFGPLPELDPAED